jgi:hypothetical protein
MTVVLLKKEHIAHNMHNSHVFIEHHLMVKRNDEMPDATYNIRK